MISIYTSKLKRLGVGVSALAVLFAVGSLFPAGTKANPSPTDVLVTNFPATQAVSGTVSVGNFPAFPATQAVSGTVSVGNFPASTQTVVMNTTSAPAITLSADRATRIPYQSSRILNTCSGLQNCAFPAFTAVPAGYRLVVQNVSGFFNLTTGSPAVAGYLENFHLPNDNVWGLNAPTGGTGFNGESFAGLNQNVTAVFDTGEFPFVVIYGNFLGGFNQIVNVSGYLENCSVVGCPGVQH